MALSPLTSMHVHMPDQSHTPLSLHISVVSVFLWCLTGHMMYFTFMWWMAALFCTLALLVGVPNLAINLAGK